MKYHGGNKDILLLKNALAHRTSNVMSVTGPSTLLLAPGHRTSVNLEPCMWCVSTTWRRLMSRFSHAESFCITMKYV